MSLKNAITTEKMDMKALANSRGNDNVGSLCREHTHTREYAPHEQDSPSKLTSCRAAPTRTGAER